MPQYETNVRKSVAEAADYLEQQIRESSLSAELLERYSLFGDGGKSCTIMIFEKYYMRNSSRISLTISIDDLKGSTRICATTSGGGESMLFSFDWGAGSSFIDSVIEIVNAMQ
jgi:hypothetical protein